jgi:hypothetical protein
MAPSDEDRMKPRQRRKPSGGRPTVGGLEPSPAPVCRESGLLFRLELPLPESPNRRKSHHMALHRQAGEYKAAAWARAIRQARPLHELDVPMLVVIRSRFYLPKKRDDDNASSSLKWAIDSLKWKQTGRVEWKQGAFDEKGYFYDDDPAHCSVEKPHQVVQRTDHRLEVEIWNG